INWLKLGKAVIDAL
uniref:Protopolybia-mastoparan-III n=1 Tax=Protopolybia exigua TaxID=91439 RepID=MAST3_PROEX|nr:RecName: Full=Protopolybia-mastoparan-III; Short=Protopolybia-MP-III; Short=Protopolybia-MPIII [Protopolybia exigua]